MASQSTSSDTWSAAQYNKNASFVYSHAFTSPILSLLDAKPGERIFDFGCGSGEVSLEIREAVGSDGFVAGVDSSASMVRFIWVAGVCYILILAGQPMQEQWF